MTAHYDTIGIDYANLRKPDPRIAAAVELALGDAETIVNVGAGAGSYEPVGRRITAVEPSAKMIAQRPSGTAEIVQASAEDLPFEDNSFDAAMAVLTVHHWEDKAKGLAEMRRVSRGPVVILTFDPDWQDFWLWDYLPELAALDSEIMPPMSYYEEHLPALEVKTVPVPHDCTDGFLCAYWRRPTAYLDPKVRAAMSSFWTLGDRAEVGLAALADDLENGRWSEKYGHVVEEESLDLGYRLVISR